MSIYVVQVQVARNHHDLYVVEQLRDLLSRSVPAFVFGRHPYLSGFFQYFLPDIVFALSDGSHRPGVGVLAVDLILQLRKKLVETFHDGNSIVIRRRAVVLTANNIMAGAARKKGGEAAFERNS